MKAVANLLHALEGKKLLIFDFEGTVANTSPLHAATISTYLPELFGAHKMCNTITKNISPFWIYWSISRLSVSICLPISKEITAAQVQSLASKNKLLNCIKVGVTGLLSKIKISMSIYAVYQKSQ
jgi:hypothetical protein